MCAATAVPYLTEEFYPALASPVYRTTLVPGEDTLATSRHVLLSLKILTELSDALATAGARAQSATTTAPSRFLFTVTSKFCRASNVVKSRALTAARRPLLRLQQSRRSCDTDTVSTPRCHISVSQSGGAVLRIARRQRRRPTRIN